MYVSTKFYNHTKEGDYSKQVYPIQNAPFVVRRQQLCDEAVASAASP